MAGETVITVIGNLTADPELRFTPSGAAVANFTVASTPRTFDRQSQEWKDGDTLFMRASVWRDQAQHVAESLKKGMRVIVTGNLVQKSYETKEGEKRTSVEMQVTEVGPSMLYATAQVTRLQKEAGSGGGYTQPQQGFAPQQQGYAPQQQGFAPQQPPAQQEWSQPPAQQAAPAPQAQAATPPANIAAAGPWASQSF